MRRRTLLLPALTLGFPAAAFAAAASGTPASAPRCTRYGRAFTDCDARITIGNPARDRADVLAMLDHRRYRPSSGTIEDARGGAASIAGVAGGSPGLRTQGFYGARP